MTAADHALTDRLVDGAFGAVGLGARVLVYGLVGSFANRYGCGPALLTGALVGDFAGSVVRTIWVRNHGLGLVVIEWVVLVIAWLWLQDQLRWSADPADRALLGLAAFGVFAGRVGSAALQSTGTVASEWE